MAKNRYVVARGASIMAPNGKQLHEGVLLDPADFKAGWLEDAVKSGHVKRIGAQDEEEPLTENTTVKSTDGADNAEATIDGISIGKPAQPVQPGPPATIKAGTVKGRLVGKWNLDPKSLARKSLLDLNTMVRERDSTIAPFKDKDEAIAQLSGDFETKGE